ncbi:MAG: hypothetical protein FWC98_05385 [Bacteroidales bacterium]|nr:hypothetical protein [Bacteroidales bacterium]
MKKHKVQPIRNSDKNTNLFSANFKSALKNASLSDIVISCVSGGIAVGVILSFLISVRMGLFSGITFSVLTCMAFTIPKKRKQNLTKGVMPGKVQEKMTSMQKTFNDLNSAKSSVQQLMNSRNWYLN